MAKKPTAADYKRNRTVVSNAKQTPPEKTPISDFETNENVTVMSSKFGDDGSMFINLKIPAVLLCTLARWTMEASDPDISDDMGIQKVVLKDTEFQTVAPKEVAALINECWGAKAYSDELKDFDGCELLRRLILRK